MKKTTTDNLILIKGGAYADVKKALKQWINLYTEKLQDDFTFQLFKNGRGQHAIQADERLDNTLFYYLINYLNCPDGINYAIDLEGFTTGGEDNLLKDKELLVYISPTDKDGDNVFVVTSENENFKVDFGGKINETRENKTYNRPVDLTLESPEVLKVDKTGFEQAREEARRRTEKSVKKRFKIISVISVIFLLSACFICFVLQNKDVFLMLIIFLTFGIFAWIEVDEKLLLKEKKYFRCCFRIAVSWWIFGIISGKWHGQGAFLAFIGMLPLFGLMVIKADSAFRKVVDRRRK